MTERPSIYVVIVTWNGMKWIENCLNALRQSTVQVSTIVIDNGSKDDTVDFIRTNFPEIDLIVSEKNLGFGQGNNVGIRKALDNGADYIFLLNQDAYVFPDMFAKLIDVASHPENGDYAIFTPMHMRSDRRTLDCHFEWYIRDIKDLLSTDKHDGKQADIYPVYATPAAGWMLPRSTFDEIGGFDPIFFHYGEDNHYSYRVAYHGKLIGIVPDAKMVHDRDDFGNISAAKKDMHFRTVKTEICLNLLLNGGALRKRFVKTCLSMTFESLKALAHGNFHMIVEYQKAIWKNIIAIPTYARNRKHNKVKRPNWL